MHWIALLPCHDEEREAWSWHALQFTPRVAFVDEALLLEVSASERLWGGRRKLLRKLLKGHPLQSAACAQGPTSLVALGLLRLALRGEPAPTRVPDDLPVTVLSSALAHAGTLARLGCRTWGGLRALPRGGLNRRFGAQLLDDLACAYGARSDRHQWLTCPAVFDQKVELPSLATTAPELLWSAQRLLSLLQVWLQSRDRGVLALELEWTLDLRRLNGVTLPSHEQLVLRTAQPAREMSHLRRLAGEQLACIRIAAPANQLRLRTLDTVPWPGASKSLLPEDNRPGEPLHQLVERLGARLGEASVVAPVAHADHRPEAMQEWMPFREAQAAQRRQDWQEEDALYPTWLLPKPVPLQVHRNIPHYHGPLRLLSRALRVESGWWDGEGLALRDYFVARSEEAGLVWVYCERPASIADSQGDRARWFLQGLYA